MHQEILDPKQAELLPLVKQFKREYYLAGGTAIALHIGHRRSVDFDLFKNNPVNAERVIQKINKFSCPYLVTRRVTEQLNITIKGVKFTFFQYPFNVTGVDSFGEFLRMPPLLELASMKAYALGRRSKWKDYIDMYYILKDHLSIDQIAERSKLLFGQLFSEKLFRAQLSFFADIDFSEPIEFIKPPVNQSEIKEFLTEKAIDLSGFDS